MEEEGKGVEIEPQIQDERGSEVALSPFWTEVRRVVTSWWFQKIMMGMVICYILSAVAGVVIGFLKEEFKTPAWNLALKVAEILNFLLLVIFLVETLVRATLALGGMLEYFSNPWHLLDFILIVASGVLEIVDLLDILVVADESTIFGVVRVVSALRTLNMLHRNAIDTEILINRTREEIIAHMMKKLVARETENAVLLEDLSVTTQLINYAKNETEKLKTHMLLTKKKSWDQLVPKSFSISKTPKDEKLLPKSSPRRSNSIASFKLVKSTRSKKRLSLPLLSFTVADINDAVGNPAPSPAAKLTTTSMESY